MSTYEVQILADGNDCGTYTVQADDQWKARNPATLAMFARIDGGEALPFVSGASIEYAVQAV